MAKKPSSKVIQRVSEDDLRPHHGYVFLRPRTAGTPADLDTLITEALGTLRVHFPSTVETARGTGDHKGTVSFRWLTYERKAPVSWLRGTPLLDTQNHLLFLIAKADYIAVNATDARLLTALLSEKADRASCPSWKSLRRVGRNQLVNAFVQGKALTLWLSGIHRSVEVKPDAKMLTGSNLEYSLDPMGDQSYQFTAVRSTHDLDDLSARSIGVNAQAARVWMGGSKSCDDFLDNTNVLLAELAAAAETAPSVFPVLASAGADMTKVSGAFDFTFTAPELLYGEDVERVSALEDAHSRAVWTIRAAAGASFRLTLDLDGYKKQLPVSVKEEDGRFRLEVPKDQVEKLKAYGASQTYQRLVDELQIFGGAKVYYDSLHTLSDGQLFEIRTRPAPFKTTNESFKDFDVSQEKPELTKTDAKGNDYKVADLGKIGAVGDPSLFSWVLKRWSSGFLLCDDGAGEVADFIHIDSNKTRLSLIHVKAADSASPDRRIAVTAYEVVCAQALKNLRYLDSKLLQDGLKEKIEQRKASRGSTVGCWQDGKRVAEKAFQAHISATKYSKLNKRVVIVQPHVHEDMLPADLNTPGQTVNQTLLLYTLLNSIEADVKRLGADFEVVVDATPRPAAKRASAPARTSPVHRKKKPRATR